MPRIVLLQYVFVDVAQWSSFLVELAFLRRSFDRRQISSRLKEPTFFVPQKISFDLWLLPLESSEGRQSDQG